MRFLDNSMFALNKIGNRDFVYDIIKEHLIVFLARPNENYFLRAFRNTITQGRSCSSRLVFPLQKC